MMKRIRIFALAFLIGALLLILTGVALTLKENKKDYHDQKPNLDIEVESDIKDKEPLIVHCVKENVTEKFVYTHLMDITLSTDNNILYYTLEVKTKCLSLNGYNQYKKVEADNDAIITYDDTNFIISKKYVNKKLYDANNQEAVVSYDSFKSTLTEQSYICDK